MPEQTIRVVVVSAEQELYRGEATLVVAPGTEGELGIAPGHMPLLTRLKPGDLRIRLEEEEDRLIYVSGGLLEVQPFLVNVLADSALRAQDLDEKAAREAADRARRELAENGDRSINAARAQALLAEAEAQLRTLEDLRRLRRTQRTDGRG